jgi:hypothetical protein
MFKVTRTLTSGARTYPVSGANPFNVQRHPGNRFYLGSGSSKICYRFEAA